MTHHHLTESDREALSQRIPLPQLLSLAGQGPRLTVDQLEHAGSLELALKRQALTRIKAGELCMVPCRGPAVEHQAVPSLDLRAFWSRHGEGGA